MEYLSPKQVARAIGASEASLKRWCDAGLFPTTRTAGGHRRIPLYAVLDYLRREGKAPADPTVLGLPATTGQGTTVRKRARGQVLAALREGNESQLRTVLFDLYLAGLEAWEIADELIAPAFHDIGEEWYQRRLDVYQERRACEICVGAVHQLCSALSPLEAEAPLAIGAAPGTDPYILPTTLAAWTLRADGWDARSLGNNLPVASLREAAGELKPRLVWLSVSWVQDCPALMGEVRELDTALREMGIRLIVGGAWVDEVKRSASVSGANLGELVGFAREIAGSQAEVEAQSRPDS